MNWFYLAFATAFLYALPDIIGKYIADKKSEPFVLGIIANFYAAIVALILVFFENISYSTDIKSFLKLIVAAFFYAIGTYTYYTALKLIPVSQFTLFTRSSVLITLIGGVIFFKETLTGLQIIGVFLILTAILLLSINKGKIVLNKGSVLALSTALFFAIATMIDRSVIEQFSSSFYLVLSYSITTLFLLIPLPLYLKKSKQFPSLKTNGLLFITSSLFAIAGFTTYQAYQLGGPVSLVQLLSQFRIVIVIVYGLTVLKEKEHLTQKIIAMILMIIGTYLLY